MPAADCGYNVMLLSGGAEGRTVWRGGLSKTGTSSLLKFTKFGGFSDNEETDSEVKTIEMEHGAGNAQASLSRHRTNHHFTTYTPYQKVSTCVDRDRYT